MRLRNTIAYSTNSIPPRLLYNVDRRKATLLQYSEQVNSSWAPEVWTNTQIPQKKWKYCEGSSIDANAKDCDIFAWTNHLKNYEAAIVLETNGIWDLGSFLSPADELFRFSAKPRGVLPSGLSFYSARNFWWILKNSTGTCSIPAKWLSQYHH